MNNDRIDSLYRQKLASFEVKASEDAWGEIQAKLQENQTDKIHNNKKRIFWISAIAASLALILTTFFVWNASGPGTSELALANPDLSLSGSETETLESIISEKSQSDNPDLVYEKTTHQNILITDDGEKDRNSKQEILLAENNSNEDTGDALDMDAQTDAIDALIVPLEKKGPEFLIAFDKLNPDFQIVPVEEIDLPLPRNETGIKKAYDFAKRLKNGEENLIDLRKAKQELVAMAKNIKFTQSKPN